MVAARLALEFPNILQESCLKAIVAEVDAQGTGMVDHHTDDLEDKGSHRGKITTRWWHFATEVKVDPR